MPSERSSPRKTDPAVERWRDRYGPELEDAIVAVWNDRNSPAQRRVVDAYCDHMVWAASWSTIQAFTNDLGYQAPGLRSTRADIDAAPHRSLMGILHGRTMNGTAP